jgi:hypothetical protein
MFIILANDGQYTYNSTCVVGVSEKLDDALNRSWTHLVGSLLRPWLIERYKNKILGRCFADVYIEEWREDSSQGKPIQRIFIGYDQTRNSIKNALYDFTIGVPDYEDCVRSWLKQLQSGTMPDELVAFTFQDKNLTP